jgi:hypothetical protein
MRYQGGTAAGGWCTERTACGVEPARARAVALAAAGALVAGMVTACGEKASSDSVQRRAAAIDTRGTSAAGTSSVTAKPACPATGAWQLCSVIERLDRAGLAPRQEPGRVLEAPLARPGVAILVGRSELRIFFYADRAARERDQAKLDPTKYTAASEALSMNAQPTLIASENLLAILRSRSDHQRERVSDALTAGPPQRAR